MTTAIALADITIHPVVEQQGPFFDVFEFFPTLTKELLEENRAWLQPTFIDPASGRLVLCVQSFLIKSPHHNILIDSCVGNDKPRPARPMWNMMKGDRFEQGKWTEFLYGSRLASALGAWPWADVFMSTEEDNLLLATLSAGMVGVGDELGAASKQNLLKAVRGDGVIVKPDAPIVPLDAAWLYDCVALKFAYAL